MLMVIAYTHRVQMLIVCIDRVQADYLQGYLAHKKTPTPLRAPQDPWHRLTVGS